MTNTPKPRDDSAPELFEALEAIETVLRSTGFHLVTGASRSGYVFAGLAAPGQPVRIACHGDCLADCFAELSAILQAAPSLVQCNPGLTDWVPHT